jgi:hypothetical protein
LRSHAESDDVLVRRDGEEEEPDGAGVFGEAERHPLKDAVEGESKDDKEAAKGALKKLKHYRKSPHHTTPYFITTAI